MLFDIPNMFNKKAQVTHLTSHISLDPKKNTVMYTKGVTNVIKRKRKKNSLFKSFIILSAKRNMVVEKKGLENW